MIVVVTTVVDEPEPRVYVRVVSEEPPVADAPLPAPPVPTGTEGAGVVAAPPLPDDDPEPGAAEPAVDDGPDAGAPELEATEPGAVPDGVEAAPPAVVEAATYEEMTAELTDEACSTGQTV